MDVTIFRKGAIAAPEGKKVIIPMNMRDGCIVCVGKGNPGWNWSAPHGSGRICSRKKVREAHTLSEYKKEMGDIYSTCINKDTLDEAPFAYRPRKDIIDFLGDAVYPEETLLPFYNFKAGGKQ